MVDKDYYWLCEYGARRLELIYGGPASNAWDIARNPNNRGVRTISLSSLKKLHAELPPEQQLKRS